MYRDARRSADGSFAVFMRRNDGGFPRLGLSIAARVINRGSLANKATANPAAVAKALAFMIFLPRRTE